jgi:hypothetical protein
MFLADQGDIGCLDHGVSGFDGGDETFGFAHAESLQSCPNSCLLGFSCGLCRLI